LNPAAPSLPSWPSHQSSGPLTYIKTTLTSFQCIFFTGLLTHFFFLSCPGFARRVTLGTRTLLPALPPGPTWALTGRHGLLCQRHRDCHHQQQRWRGAPRFVVVLSLQRRSKHKLQRRVSGNYCSPSPYRDEASECCFPTACGEAAPRRRFRPEGGHRGRGAPSHPRRWDGKQGPDRNPRAGGRRRGGEGRASRARGQAVTLVSTVGPSRYPTCRLKRLRKAGSAGRT